MKKNIIYFLFCWLIPLTSSAQISIQFNPVVHGASINGLANAQIINNSGMDLNGYTEITVSDNRGRQIVQIKIGSQVFRKGLNILEQQAFSKASIRFGNHESSDYVRQTGRLPEGELEFCFRVNVGESKNSNIPEEFENCFQHYLQPFTPLILINPIDGEESCNLRPNFLWQPPVPIPPGAMFRLMLVAVNPKQDPVQALAFNAPLFVQQNIVGNTLLYPSIMPDLKKDNRYAWQVVMYSGATMLTKSEVWTFTTACKLEEEKPEEGSYREVRDAAGNDFLIVKDILRFAVRNPYEGGVLNYQISSMKNQEKKIKGLPKLDLRNGLNQYDIDLREYGSIHGGEEYLLTVTLKNGKKHFLRFIFNNH